MGLSEVHDGYARCRGKTSEYSLYGLSEQSIYAVIRKTRCALLKLDLEEDSGDTGTLISQSRCSKK